MLILGLQIAVIIVILVKIILMLVDYLTTFFLVVLRLFLLFLIKAALSELSYYIFVILYIRLSIQKLLLLFNFAYIDIAICNILIIKLLLQLFLLLLQLFLHLMVIFLNLF